MPDHLALSELLNQQRPLRRTEKTYGKKKPAMAQTRAMHYQLFGGGDENKIVEKISALTIKDEKVVPISGDAGDARKGTPSEKKTSELNPRFRGRRKVTSSRKVAKLTQDKLDALAPLLSLVQGQVQDFHEFGRGVGKKYDCIKLGEGAFADVFKLTPKEPKEAIELAKYGGMVIKVIPFNIENDAKDEIADLEAVSREVRVLQSLDALHGFARCRGVHVVSGRYPDVLSEAFNLFKTMDPKEAINPDPTTNLPSEQLYVIIEMNDAGSPISKLQSLSVFQAFDIFWTSAMILSMAEQKLEFEHRDLHDGNICYKHRTTEGSADPTQSLVEDMRDAPEVTLGLSNLAITVIDYTLARAKIDDSEKSVVVFDPIIFWEDNASKGESAADEKQYDTYRKVRDWAKVTEESAIAEADLDGVEHQPVHKYSRFLPKSNVMWLGYLVTNLLLRRTEGRGAYVQGSSRAAKKLQLSMWKKLEAVDAHINKTCPTLMPESADELLALAVEQEWLSPADVAAFTARLDT